MTTPLLRVVVAAGSVGHLQMWVNDLQTRLPPEVACVPWPVADLCESDWVLLLGVDSSDPLHLAHESALRIELAAHALSYQVIQPPNATPQALHAIGRALLPLAPSLAQPLLRAEVAPRWHGVCEGCSDPDCEYRLFTALTDGSAQRNGSLQG